MQTSVVDAVDMLRNAKAVLTWCSIADDLCLLLRRVILPGKDLVCGMHQGLLVGLCMRDYKSVCTKATSCATPVNI